ncbi:hypothetical protein GUJ93_ZPchr0012g21969 [Zizania palustris]|uniref:Uncharacterized protein n=1 Tax=Zizania palustris TaxID=103762 RepID=A0A8J6BVZ0_ZIZPA|nr:hypothetical protein GUJ93_ZPchr0012g21969 [Zizania palustris]
MSLEGARATDGWTSDPLESPAGTSGCLGKTSCCRLGRIDAPWLVLLLWGPRYEDQQPRGVRRVLPKD